MYKQYQQTTQCILAELLFHLETIPKDIKGIQPCQKPYPKKPNDTIKLQNISSKKYRNSLKVLKNSKPSLIHFI